MSTKQVRERIRALEHLGYTSVSIERRRRHYLLHAQAPHGAVMLLVPTSPSDYRSHSNFLADAKRALRGVTATKNGRGAR